MSMSLTHLREHVFENAHGRCEFPFCDQPATDLVHIVHKGRGGNPDGTRNVPENCLAGCHLHHMRYDGAQLTAADLNNLLTATRQTGGCCWPDCNSEVETRALVTPAPPGAYTFPVCHIHKPVLDVKKPYPYRRRHIADLLRVIAAQRESLEGRPT